jgi:hypothetical protein
MTNAELVSDALSAKGIGANSSKASEKIDDICSYVVD